MHAAIVGLAAKRYQLAEGRLPDTLDDLVPGYLDKVPIDPFSGKPLRYKKTDSGAVIYGVGRDRIDNGGREYNDKGERHRTGADMTFTITANNP